MMFSCCSSFVGVTLGRGGTGGPFLVCEGDLGRTGAGDAGANVWLGLAVGLGRVKPPLGVMVSLQCEEDPNHWELLEC